MNRAWTRSPTPATVPCEASGTPCSVDPAEADELGAQLRGQAGGLLVGVDQQQRAAAGEGVGQPGAGGGLLGLLAGAGVEQPAVLVVGAQHVRVAVAQPQRRLALPVVGEPAGLGELVAVPGGGEQVHAAAGADRGELAVVADQQQLRPRRVHVAVDGGERGGVGHGGLVDHDQVPGVQPPRLVALDRLRPARRRGRRRAGPGWPASGRRCGRSGLRR